jgi:hypothetical protein
MALDASAQDQAALELWLVDLNVGWAAFELSMAARDWRKVSPVQPFAPGVPPQPGPGGDYTAILEASVERARAERATADQAGVGGRGDDSVTIDAYRSSVRAWLQHRIDVIGHTSPEARMDIVHRWPTDLPTLRQSDAHTSEHLDVIERLLDDIERAWGVSFPSAKPKHPDDEAIARVVQMFPGTEPTKEHTK